MLRGKYKRKTVDGYTAYLTCDMCGKKFKRSYSLVCNQKKHFCSRECFGRYSSISQLKKRKA